MMRAHVPCLANRAGNSGSSRQEQNAGVSIRFDRARNFVRGLQPRACSMNAYTVDRQVHDRQEILIRPQPKGYDGVRYSVVQKTTEPQGKHIVCQKTHPGSIPGISFN
jgi:hypothetical protein